MAHKSSPSCLVDLKNLKMIVDRGKNVYTYTLRQYEEGERGHNEVQRVIPRICLISEGEGLDGEAERAGYRGMRRTKLGYQG